MTRRSFLFQGAAAFGLGGMALFAAPPGWRPKKRPNVVFGVLADTHFRTDGEWRRGVKSGRYFASALECFRDRNVDAVAICGDMADRGLVDEMQFHADIWRRVFPENRAPDGHVVEKLFVTGNHDVHAWRKDFDFSRLIPDRAKWPEKILREDIYGNWERIWGEKYEPVWCKKVRGYHFFGLNWDVAESELLRTIARNADGVRPYFFVSHNRTHREFNREIAKYPGGVGLWGHWHQSATNWMVVKMLNATTPSVQCPACPSWWRPDGRWMGGGDGGIVDVPLQGKLQAGKWQQGYVMYVYDDMLVIERREFSKGGCLGANWVMPLGPGEELRKRDVAWRHPFSREELKKVIGTPQFRKGAKLAFPALSGSCVKIQIPLADGCPESRVYGYKIEVVGRKAGEREGGDACLQDRKPSDSQTLVKAVYAVGANMGAGQEPNGGITELDMPKSELPSGNMLIFTVTPFTSLSTFGKPITACLRLGDGNGVNVTEASPIGERGKTSLLSHS